MPPTRHARPLDHVAFALAVIGASAGAAGFAITLRLAIDHTSALLLGAPELLSAFRELPWWARLAAPAAGALAGGIVAMFAARLPESRGVGDVLEAVVLGRARISFRASIAKALASFCAIVGGGSLGREGPIIQVGAALGGTAGAWFGLTPSRTRVLYAAGTAAGFAAAYNTPIAATLFVLEIVTGVVALEVIVPVVVASAIATGASRLALGDGPFYGLRAYELVTPAQLAASVAIGPIAGLAGVAFMRMLAGGESLFARVPAPRPLRAALGGLIVGGLAIGMPEVTGNGADVIREMLDGRVLGLAFLALLFAKPVATTASVASGSAGGVFTPSMFIGAALGGGLATLLLAGTPAERVPVVGACALVGMASMIAATTHAPLMASVLAFEMSGDYALVIPLLAATSLATATARALARDSIYTSELRRRGIAWDGSVAHRLARAVRARDILEPALVLAPTASAADASAAIVDQRGRVAYTTFEGGPAAIDLRTLAGSHGSQTAARELAVAVAPVRLDDDVPTLSERLWTAEWGELPVIDDAGTIVGIVTRRGLLGAFDRELLQRDLLLTRLTWSESARSALIELPRGHRMRVVRPPAAELDRPLDVPGIRARAGVWVIAVRPEGARAPWKDSGDAGLVANGDRWLVIGPASSIDALEPAP